MIRSQMIRSLVLILVGVLMLPTVGLAADDVLETQEVETALQLPQYTEKEMWFMARVAHHEANTESDYGIALVLQCMIDRHMSGIWGSDMIGLLEKPNQFASPNSKEVSQRQYDLLVDILENGLPLPDYQVLNFQESNSKKDWYSPFLFKEGCHAFYGYKR